MIFIISYFFQFLFTNTQTFNDLMIFINQYRPTNKYYRINIFEPINEKFTGEQYYQGMHFKFEPRTR